MNNQMQTPARSSFGGFSVGPNGQQQLLGGLTQVANAATTDLGEFRRPGVGADGRISTDQIYSQEFQPDTSSIIGGVGSGAVGLATGNIPMAVAGLGSAAISGVRSGIAQKKFNEEKARAMRSARRHNFGVDYREEYMDNLGGSFNDAFNRFY